MKKIILCLCLICMLSLLLTGCPVGPTTTTSISSETTTIVVRKPVIYLYPIQKTNVTVRLQYAGQLTCTYPAYDGLWQVIAWPDGTLRNLSDGKTYSYLYWEGQNSATYDFSKGFVVKGDETAAFLQDKLACLGLTPKEYNEFIVYWLPFMQDNPYNLISFQDEAYTNQARLKISPEPESILRIFMAYKPLDHYEAVEEQPLAGFRRNGFTVVEWGGCCVD